MPMKPMMMIYEILKTGQVRVRPRTGCRWVDMYLLKYVHYGMNLNQAVTKQSLSSLTNIEFTKKNEKLK